MIIIPKKEFRGDVQQFKDELTGNAWLNRAGELAAQKKRILQDPTLSDELKVDFSKPVSRQLRRATKRLRQIPSSGGDGGEGEEEDDDDLVSTNVEKWLKRLARHVQTPTTPRGTPRSILQGTPQSTPRRIPSGNPRKRLRQDTPIPLSDEGEDIPTTSSKKPTLTSSMLRGALGGLFSSSSKKGPSTRSKRKNKGPRGALDRLMAGDFSNQKGPTTRSRFRKQKGKGINKRTWLSFR